MRYFETQGSGDAAALYAPSGQRKYLNVEERGRFLAAAETMPPDKALFALTLAWTGARISEVLDLRVSSFQVAGGIIAFRTLKRRRHSIRELPIPGALMQALDGHFDLGGRQAQTDLLNARLWFWHRATAWRIIKQVMTSAGLTGLAATPRGLRHAFGVGTLQGGIPITLTQKWLGHSRVSTTAIYAAVCGEEERHFAERFWRNGASAGGPRTVRAEAGRHAA